MIEDAYALTRARIMGDLSKHAGKDRMEWWAAYLSLCVAVAEHHLGPQ